jgi:hypothetical protein
MVTFGEKGEVYVIEAGFSYGPATSIPRILKYRDGYIYAIGGRDPAKIWRVDLKKRKIQTVLSGFPVWGHHFTSELVFGPDGKMYFGLGQPSNSGVVDMLDVLTFGWVTIFPQGRGIPSIDHELIDRNYVTDNPFKSRPER